MYRHFNHHVYNFDEIFIPGGLVLGLTLSAANRDLHEVLHENLSEVSTCKRRWQRAQRRSASGGSRVVG